MPVFNSPGNPFALAESRIRPPSGSAPTAHPPAGSAIGGEQIDGGQVADGYSLSRSAAALANGFHSALPAPPSMGATTGLRIPRASTTSAAGISAALGTGSNSNTQGSGAVQVPKKLHELEIERYKYQLQELRDGRDRERLSHSARVAELEKKQMEDVRAIEALQTDKRFLFDLGQKAEAELAALTEKGEAAEKEAAGRVRDAENKARSVEDELITLREQQARELQAAARAREVAQSEAESQQRALAALRNDLAAKASLLAAQAERIAALEDATQRANDDRAAAKEQDDQSVGFLTKQLAESVGRIQSLEIESGHRLAQVHKLQEKCANHAVLQEQKLALERQLDQLDEIRARLALAELERDTIRPRLADAEDRLAALDAAAAHTGGGGADGAANEAGGAQLESLTTQLGLLEQQLAHATEGVSEWRSRYEATAGESKSLSARVSALERAQARIERSKGLALREVEFLRGQLKSYDLEEELESPNFDRHKATRIEQLELLVQEYRAELDAKPASVESQSATDGGEKAGTGAVLAGTKRPRDDGDDGDDAINGGRGDFNNIERGEYLRKIRGLAAELELTRKRDDLLTKELDELRVEHRRQLADKEQLVKQLAAAVAARASNAAVSTNASASVPAATAAEAGTATAGGRVLELKDNPAARHLSVRTRELRDLRAENGALLAQLEGRGDVTTPIASLRNAEAEIDRLKSVVKQKDTMLKRLREVFAAKSSEFREAVFSLLGYKLDFLPNGRVRLTSMYADQGECAFVFDGEAGTMQLSTDLDAGGRSGGNAAGASGNGGGGNGGIGGGNGSGGGEGSGEEGGGKRALAEKLEELIRYWSGERHSIPAMLSALTLDLLESSSSSQSAMPAAAAAGV